MGPVPLGDEVHVVLRRDRTWAWWRRSSWRPGRSAITGCTCSMWRACCISPGSGWHSEVVHPVSVTYWSRYAQAGAHAFLTLIVLGSVADRAPLHRVLRPGDHPQGTVGHAAVPCRQPSDLLGLGAGLPGRDDLADHCREREQPHLPAAHPHPVRARWRGPTRTRSGSVTARREAAAGGAGGGGGPAPGTGSGGGAEPAAPPDVRVDGDYGLTAPKRRTRCWKSMTAS